MEIAASLPPGLVGFGLTHALAAGVTTFFAIRMWLYYRDDALGQSFSVVVGTLTIWTVGAIVEMLTRLTLDPNVYAIGAAVKFVGVMLFPVAFFVFALRYDGREQWISRRFIAGLSVLPVLTIPIVLSTVTHGLFYDAIMETTVFGRPLLYASIGPAWWIAGSYAYLLLLASSILFVHAGLSRWPYYRFETAFVLGGIGLTWVTNLAYVLGNWPHPAIDPTPIGLTLTSILLVIGIFSTRLMDVPLPGQFHVYEAIDDAIVILDNRDRVVDANDAANTLLGVDSVRGEPASTLLPWVGSGTVETESPTVEEIVVDGAPRMFKQRVLAVGTDPADWRVLVLTDITDEIETERLRAQRDTVAEQRDYLRTLDSVVRHDIRNDLQVVSAYAETLETALDGENQQHAKTIRESASDAVEFTKTAGDLAETILASERELEPVRLPETVWSEVDSLQSRYDEAVLTVEGEIPSLCVKADDMLGSVFRNVIENAITHNDSPVPEVSVSATVDGDHVMVRIADNGPGIPANLVRAIFEKGEMDLETGGTGLGLYLVDVLVERYGGDVWVEDNEPTGSVFVVELAKTE